MTALRRFARFNVVGLAGIGVQLATIAGLVHVAGVNYLWATAAGVAAAVAHNFVWHARWTWRDRAPQGLALLGAFVTFAGANGLVSLAGNLALMPVFVGAVGLPLVPANLAAIAACGLINFWIGGRVCFPQVSTGWGQASPRQMPKRGLSLTCGNLWKTDPSPKSICVDAAAGRRPG